MNRPQIEEYLRITKECCGEKLTAWCETFSCKSMKEVCDYALALEKEKAELPTPLEFEHFYEYVKNLASFEWITKNCPFHPDLQKVMTWIFKQTLKEE